MHVCRWMLLYSCKWRSGCPWPTIFIERCGYGGCPSRPRYGMNLNFYLHASIYLLDPRLTIESIYTYYYTMEYS